MVDLYSLYGYSYIYEENKGLKKEVERLEESNRNLRKRMSTNAILKTKKIGGWDQYGDRWISKLNNLNYE